MRKQPTEQQRVQAAERRAKMRTLAKQVATMSDGDRVAFSNRVGIRSIDGGRNLSPFNQCFLAMQLEAVSIVGGFKQWRAAGRKVCAGSKALAIWIPIGGGSETETAEGDEDSRPRFILGNVFDVSQTEPINAELEAVAA